MDAVSVTCMVTQQLISLHLQSSLLRYKSLFFLNIIQLPEALIDPATAAQQHYHRLQCMKRAFFFLRSTRYVLHQHVKVGADRHTIWHRHQNRVKKYQFAMGLPLHEYFNSNTPWGGGEETSLQTVRSENVPWAEMRRGEPWKSRDHRTINTVVTYLRTHISSSITQKNHWCQNSCTNNNVTKNTSRRLHSKRFKSISPMKTSG